MSHSHTQIYIHTQQHTYKFYDTIRLHIEYNSDNKHQTLNRYSILICIVVGVSITPMRDNKKPTKHLKVVKSKRQTLLTDKLDLVFILLMIQFCCFALLLLLLSLSFLFRFCFFDVIVIISVFYRLFFALLLLNIAIHITLCANVGISLMLMPLILMLFYVLFLL